jgi:hypothetical protein
MIQIPKGNAFTLKVNVTAVSSEDSVLPDFDIRECTALEVRLGSVRLLPVHFEFVDANNILVPVSAGVGLGKYTLDMRGVFQGEDWRFDIQDVFQIVAHSLPVPQCQTVLKDEYQLFGVATIYNGSDIDAYTKVESDARFVQKVNGKGLSTNDYTDADKQKVGAAITQETDPTVPAWAKSPNKPTYTAQEVGALPDTTQIPTESTVAGWGFTKNAGTITGITMNGASKGTSGVVNLGTVVTDVSGKVDKTTTVNGKALSSNVTLSASDVGALPADTPIPVVPTNVSAFNNDAGYLTAHQDVSGKEDKVDIVVASGATLTAEVGKYYTLSSVGTLAITLPTIAAGTTTLQTVTFYIAAGSSPAVTFSSSHSVYYSDGFEIAADSTYEVSAAYNGIAWVVASVKIVIPT